MAGLVWRDAMSIDDGPIDEDHKYLIKLANEVETALESVDRDKILSLLKNLEYYTVYHFTREEALQREIGYNDYDEHCVRHKQLVEVVHNAVGLFSQEFSEDKNRRLAEDVVKLMNAWIVGHILTQDLPMRSYVRMHKQGPRRAPITTV
ncbi:MAG: hemerythrin family protein [Rhodospirillaceae bacterium]